MVGLGTIINVAAIVLGGFLGLLFGKFLIERIQETLQKTCGISVLFIGIAGALEGMMTKAILDLIIVMVMACSLGKGCIFSAIPVAFLQGSVTAFARMIRPIMTEAALNNLSLIGSVLIFCVGLNLVWGKKVRVANLLPALLIAVLLANIGY